MKITAVAYADDLHPIATSIQDLQKQLDIIHNFLSFHDMRMGLAKTHILTNVSLSNKADFPNSTTTVNLGGSKITSIKTK
jgi:hypothetical protein